VEVTGVCAGSTRRCGRLPGSARVLTEAGLHRWLSASRWTRSLSLVTGSTGMANWLPDGRGHQGAIKTAEMPSVVTR